MSETTEAKTPEPAETHAGSSTAGDMFGKADLKFFDAEDGHAGNVIGKMLALFFLYTVLAMSIVAYWTFSVAD